MKNIALFALFVTFAACSTVAGLLPQNEKQKASDDLVKIICADPAGSKEVLKGTKFEGEINIDTLCK